MIDTVFHIYNKEGCVDHNLTKSELKEKILKDEIPLDDIIEIMPVNGEEMSDASY